MIPVKGANPTSRFSLVSWTEIRKSELHDLASPDPGGRLEPRRDTASTVIALIGPAQRVRDTGNVLSVCGADHHGRHREITSDNGPRVEIVFASPVA
jgi:hypothetical protein